MKRMIAAILGLCLLCAAGAPAKCVSAVPELVILLYMTGSDLESKDGTASRDLREIMDNLPGDGSVEVCAMIAGSGSWDMDIPPEETSVYRVCREGLKKLREGAPASMGDAETLSGFLNYAAEACPARRYALILWDHGAGPVLGVCFDERYQTGSGMDGLTLAELNTALANSPFKERTLSWIGFDACLMGTVETAYTVAPYAEYMIASQEMEPADGWNYGFLSDIARMEGAEAGKHIVDAYMQGKEDSLSILTLSVTDLSKIGEVSREMTEVFGRVEVTRENYPDIARIREDTKEIGCTAPVSYDLVDLIDLLEVAQDEDTDCAGLLEALSGAVVYNRANIPYLNGLSVYYPFNNAERYVYPWSSNYRNLEFSNGYLSFIQSFTKVWLGDSIADWSGDMTLEGQSGNLEQRFQLQLTPDQLRSFASARLVVLEQHANWSMDDYSFVYSTDDVAVSESGLLSAVYREESMVMEDETGERHTNNVSYEELDDALGIRVLLSRGWMAKPDYEITGAYLVYRRNAAGDWQLANVLRLGDDEEQSGRREIDLSEWDEIRFLSYMRTEKRDDHGAPLGFEEWDKHGRAKMNIVLREEVGDLTRLRPVLVRQQDSYNRYAYLEVRDLQNRITCTQLFSIDNLKIQSAEKNAVLADNGYCKLTLDRVQVATGDNAQIRMDFTAVNKTDQTVDLLASQVMLDDIYIAGGTVRVTLKPGETQSFERAIMPETLRNNRCAMLEEIGATLTGLSGEDELFSERIALPIHIDTRVLAGDMEDSVLARAEWPEGGMTAELLSVERVETSYPHIRAVLRLINLTDELIAFESEYAWINGVGDFNSLIAIGDRFGFKEWDLMPRSTAYFAVDFYEWYNVEYPIRSIAVDVKTVEYVKRLKFSIGDSR